MVSGAKTELTVGRQFKKNRINIKNLQSQIRQIEGPKTNIPVRFGTGGSGTLDPIQRLATQGDTMIGPIAFFPRAQTVVSGVVDVSSTSILQGYTSRIIVLGQGAVADDVDTIAGAAFAGQLLILQAVATTPITLKHLTDNIRIPSGNDYVVKGLESVILVFDSTSNEWVLVIGDSGLTNPMTSDLDMATFDILNVDRLQLVVDSGVPRSSGDPSIYLDTSGDMAFNVAPADGFFWRENDIALAELKKSGSTITFDVKSVDDDTPVISISRFDSTPIVGASVGRLVFNGVDSGGSTQEEFGRIRVDAEDLTIGSVDGSMHLGVDLGSSPVTFISLNNSNDGLVTFWKNIFLETAINIELDSNNIYTTLSSNPTFISGASSSIGMFVDDAVTAKGTFGSTRLNLKNDYYLQTQAVELRNVAADIGGINGTIWYNSTTNKFRGRENAANVDLVGGAGSQTPWVADIDADGFSLQDLDDIEFSDDVTDPAASVAYINKVTANMQFNVPTADGFIFKINAVQAFGIGASTINIFAGTVDFNGNDIIDIDDIVFTGAASVINMSGGDITGWDTIQATGATSEILMVGGLLSMDDGDITDAKDITLHNNGRVLAEGSVEIGFQVDNAVATVGSAGMMAIPVVNLTTSLTKAILDAAFGDHEGAMGLDTNTLINSRLWIREANGNWRGFDYDASVTS